MAPPTATVVFLAHDRRDDLRLSLTRTLEGLDYDRSALDVIVVDNASSDGTAEMVEAEFPEARLIKRTSNRGVSGWNDGFAEARGDYVLALDDDCHLPPDGLRRAVAEAERHDADLVSFGVTSASDSAYRFDIDEYLTGLFSFWGCAVLVRRRALEELDGYALDAQSTSYLWAEYGAAGVPGTYAGHFVYSNDIGWQAGVVGLAPASPPTITGFTPRLKT